MANYELNKFHDRISQELDQASKAQQFILPTTFPENKKVKFSALHKPIDVIGGDYYDVIELNEGIYGIMIADVTGHGIPAALLTFMTSFAFKNSVQRHTTTAQVVASTNKKLINKMPRGAFITMFYAVYDSHTKALRFTQAGHPQGLILRSATKEVIPLATDGKLVGVFKYDKTGFGEKKISMQTGDKLILYTDAIIENRNKQNQMLEISALNDFLIANRSLPISKLFDKIYQFGIDFSGKNAYDDDFTLVGLDV